MLVLTRKRHELIRIGDEVVIKVIRTAKGSVKLGINAPPHIRVLRGELSPFEDERCSSEEFEFETEEEPELVTAV